MKRLFITLIILVSTTLFSAERRGHILIDKEINRATLLHVKESLNFFEKEGIERVIVEINTPGGEVDSAVKIARSFIESPLEISAYINDWAISAGALIAYSISEVRASPTAIVGASEPVHQDGQQLVTASEKINSVMRAQMATLALHSKRDPLIAKAMVDKDVVIIEKDGNIVEVKNGDVGENDHLISEKGKLLTLYGEDLIKFQVIDHVSSTIDEILEGDQLISYNSMKLGFIKSLAHPIILSALTILCMGGLYFECQSPGFGLFGAIGLTSAMLLAFVHFSLELFSYMQLGFVLLGILFLLLEIFVIPGFGVVGVMGLVSILGGIVLLTPSIDGVIVIGDRIATLSMTLVIFSVILLLFHRHILKFFTRNSPLVLRQKEETSIESEMQELVGRRFTKHTDLRPCGMISVEGRMLEATSDKGYISSSAQIEVIRVKGNKLIVRQV